MLSASAPSCASSRSSFRAAIPLCPPCSSNSLLLPRRASHWQVTAVQKLPKGFGKQVEKEKKPKKEGKLLNPSKQQPQDEDEDPEDDVVPEVVTNRMLQRITFTVGIPFVIGVAFFGLYYYLKAIKKVDIPEWLPLFTSLLTFGSAGAGITYGVLSASWDPKREGSLLGWKEAQLNWPVFWETFRGKRDSSK